MNTLLQSFKNPVWTVTEVGGIYIIAIAFALFLIYHFFDALIDAINDVVRWLKKKTE